MKIIFQKLFITLAGLLLLSACGKKNLVKETRFLMDSFCEITVRDKNEAKAKSAIAAAFKAMEEVDRLIGYDTNAEVSKIALMSGKSPVKVSGELFSIIKKAVELGDLTEGAFDITVFPLGELWGFHTGGVKRVPAQAEIDRTLPLVNYKNIILNEKEHTVFLKKKGMRIDMGGIGQGYATKKAMQVMQGLGIKNALINFSGDILGIGGPERGKSWRIGLQHPRKENEIITVFELNDSAVVTSGDYERFFISGGVRYHHIFNPRTGYPSKGIISATVLTKDPVEADCLSTSLLVLGPEKGLEIIKKISGGEALIISETEAGEKITLSPGFEKLNLDIKY